MSTHKNLLDFVFASVFKRLHITSFQNIKGRDTENQAKVLLNSAFGKALKYDEAENSKISWRQSGIKKRGRERKQGMS